MGTHTSRLLNIYLPKQKKMEEERKIVKLTLEHVDKVYQYMKDEFCPDEPVMNAFGIMQGTDFFGKMFDKEIKKEVVVDPIKSGHSFGVFDEEGNLLGIKLGKIITKENFQKPVSKLGSEVSRCNSPKSFPFFCL